MHSRTTPDAVRVASLPGDTGVSLASAIGCFTEEQLCQLAGITPSTAEAWRKRGTGPAYTRFGTRFLYPCDGVAKFIQERLRSSERVSARKVL